MKEAFLKWFADLKFPSGVCVETILKKLAAVISKT
jgi:hypothetical protein